MIILVRVMLFFFIMRFLFVLDFIVKSLIFFELRILNVFESNLLVFIFAGRMSLAKYVEREYKRWVVEK